MSLEAIRRGAPEHARRRSLAPIVAVGCIAAALWLWAQRSNVEIDRFPAVPAAFATFLAVQVMMPRARWNPELALGPGNVALLLFGLQLVALPTMLVLSGPARGTLVVMPAVKYINAALLLQALAYLCYAIGYVTTRPRAPITGLLPTRNAAVGLAVAFIAVGTLGLGLAFPSVSALTEYFSGQGDVFAQTGPSTLAGAASSFLRPFLAYGLILLWADRLRRRRPNQRLRPAELGLALIAVAASATYNYNRGSVVVPILALITAYSCFGRRQSPSRIAVGLVVLAAVGFAFGQYRTEYTGTQGGRISASMAGLDRPSESMLDTLQVYGNGPQFWSVVVQDVDSAAGQHHDTLVASALLPVPVLGKSFRGKSGTTEYNQLIYAQPDIEDQILGFGAELYWNFGVPGLAVGYLLLGLLVRRFDARVEGAPDPLTAYSWSYCGVWVALLVINSVSVLAQIVTYFFWPVVTMVVIARCSGRRHMEAQP